MVKRIVSCHFFHYFFILCSFQFGWCLVCILSDLLFSEEKELPDLYGCRHFHDCWDLFYIRFWYMICIVESYQGHICISEKGIFLSEESIQQHNLSHLFSSTKSLWMTSAYTSCLIFMPPLDSTYSLAFLYTSEKYFSYNSKYLGRRKTLFYLWDSIHNHIRDFFPYSVEAEN